MSALALGVAVLGGSTVRAGNPHHPYGVIPYGFVYPSPGHIWGALDHVYKHDMSKASNWGPHGQGYYSCASGCGPYGYGMCGGLTPPHYNAISPANFEKPYPTLPALSFYQMRPVCYPPVPGWDIPEYPAGVKPDGITSQRGMAGPITGHHDANDPPSAYWFAGREMEQNFWFGGFPQGGHGH